MLYHGSNKEIKGKFLLPRPSFVLNGDEAVFATNRFEFAAFFSAKTTDNDIAFIVHDGKFFIMEQYPGAFKMLKKGAWIYEVDPKHFKTDSRLGLQGYEFISDVKLPIHKKQYVKSIWNVLHRKSSKINVISYNKMLKRIEPLLIK